MMNNIYSFILTMVGCLMLQSAFGQQILVMDLVEQEPIANAEVIIFKKGEKLLKITSGLGIVNLQDIGTFDSLMVYHASFEVEKYAYQTLANNGFVVGLYPTTSVLPGIVIRGIPDDELKDDQPIKIDRIKSAEVKFQNPQTAADLVGMNNQIYIQKSQLGGGSPMIRGFAANNLLIVVDGVRMNNAIFRDGNLQNIITIDASLVDETEIFYGPGSVIYGSDAMGGVMAFQTKNPTIQDSGHNKGNVMLRTASANKENSWHVDVEYGKGKIAGLSSISISNFSNLTMGKNGPDSYTRPTFNEFNGTDDSIILNDNPNVQFFTGYSQINVNQKFRYKPSEKHDLIVHAGFTTSSPITRYDRLLQERNGLQRYGDWYYGPQKWAQFNARYKLNFTKFSLADKMVLTAAMQQFEESRYERLLFSKKLDSRIENVNAYTFNADFDKKAGKLDILYGFEGVYNTVGSNAFRTQIDSGKITDLNTRYPDGSTWYNAGIYIAANKNISKKTHLSLGARYSFMGLNAPFKDTFYQVPFKEINLQNSALNGSIGLTQTIKKDYKIHINLASGFRAPNVDDVGKIFDPEPGRIIVPNAGLLPEYSYSGELGFDAELMDRISFSANLFYTQVNNLIVRDDFQLNGQDSLFYAGELLRIQALVNTSSGTIYGSEYGLSIRLNSFFKLNTSFNFITGETSDGDPVRHVTPNFGHTSLNLNYRRLRAQIYANYNTELSFSQMAPSEQTKTYLYTSDADGNPYAPAWYTLNLKTGFFFSSALKLNIGLENILNKRYRPYSSGITAPGRNLILSINGRF